jgi:hypothetical protein
MKYSANPVIVEARAIKSVCPPTGRHGTVLTFEDGSMLVATLAMTARITPEPGDYEVTESDGYVYLTPRLVFERDYSPLLAPAKILQRRA